MCEMVCVGLNKKAMSGWGRTEGVAATFNPEYVEVLSQVTLAGHGNWVSSCEFTQDGRMLSASWDRSIKIWDGNEPFATDTKPIHHCTLVNKLTDWLYGATFSADNESVVAYGDNRKIFVFSSKLEELQEITTPFAGIVQCTKHPIEPNLFGVSGRDKCGILDITTGAFVNTIELPGAFANCFINDGQNFIYSVEKELYLFDLRSRVNKIKLHKFTPRSSKWSTLAYSEHEQRLAGSMSNMLYSIDMRTNKVVVEDSTHTSEIINLKYSNDSVALLSSARDCKAHLRGSEDLVPWATFEGHKSDSVFSGAISPDFSTIFTGTLCRFNIWKINCSASRPRIPVKSARKIV